MVIWFFGEIKVGDPTTEALVVVSCIPLIALLLLLLRMTELSGRSRLDGPIAFWTAFYMAFAPAGPAVYPTLPFLGVLLAIGFVVTAVVIALLLEWKFMHGERYLWYFEYGLLPFGVLFASAMVVAGLPIVAGFGLAISWATHLFFRPLVGNLSVQGARN